MRRVAGAGDGLQALVAGGALGLRDQAAQNDHPGFQIDALFSQALVHFPFQRTHLVQDVDHLAAGVGAAQHVRLPEPAVRRQDGDGEDHRHPAQELLQRLRRGCLQDVQQQSHAVANAAHVVAPAGLETQRTQVRRQLGGRGLRWAAAQRDQGLAQGIAQLGHAIDGVAEHQLLPAIAVHAQKMQQALIALADLLEQPARQGAVQELDTATDRALFAQLVAVAVERRHVDLEAEGVFVAAGGEVLFEGQVLRDGDLVQVHGLQMDAQILPARDTPTQRQIHPGGIDGRLLALRQGARQHRLG